MIRQTNESWCDYRALNRNGSYQPTLAGRAIKACFYTKAFVCWVHEAKANEYHKAVRLLEVAYTLKIVIHTAQYEF